ncbi:MAG: DUF2752 domain-containing protein [Pirellulales bacterium]|nr:DUF2752 domain-containing protein [Pirellulales bacterium]
MRCEAWLRPALKATAVAAFVGYGAWNAFWLSGGCLPPSIWSRCTGLPCPSTGVVRSLLALWSGNFSDFVLYNPFTIAFIALLMVSLLFLLKSWDKRHIPQVPAFVARLWLVTLTSAWVAKFVIGSQYW